MLLSDAGHMLSDVGAIAGSLWAIRLAARAAAGAWTFGWKRTEILPAAGNGVAPLVVSGIVAFEAIRRLIDPPTVQGGPVLVVALIGVALNIVVAWILAKAHRSSLNVENAYQHIRTDLYGFIGTVTAAVVILTTGFNRADAIASLIVVALMLEAFYTTNALGLIVTATSLLLMPVLGIAKKRLGGTLDPGATAGEGIQNLICAAQAAAVLIGMAATALFGWSWVDPTVALLLPAWAIREGREAWHCKQCC